MIIRGNTIKYSSETKKKKKKKKKKHTHTKSEIHESNLEKK